MKILSYTKSYFPDSTQRLLAFRTYCEANFDKLFSGSFLALLKMCVPDLANIDAITISLQSH